MHRHQKSDSSSSSEEEEPEYQSGYSSSLLQQFVEKTEILSAQCERLISSGRARKMATQNNLAVENVPERRAKRGRPPKIVKNVISVGGGEGGQVVMAGGDRSANKMMPELEAYRLDCSHSNVSPDSGIQSVPGSPINENIHRSPNRDATPPVLRPVSPVKGVSNKLIYKKKEEKVKKRPGRPKKMPNEPVRNVQNRVDVEDSKSEDRPPIHSLIPGKRGPGRPKKAPPILEPNIPINKRKGAFETETENNLNIMLNEICERVNRRLEIPVSKGPVRTIDINKEEIKRIITDHKSGKSSRNSKIDAIFSKSKRISDMPNVAIVKPMQHHIAKERQEDDEKQSKRLKRRRKNSQDDSKWKDLDLVKQKLNMELKENDSVDKKTKEIAEESYTSKSGRKRSEKERKAKSSFGKSSPSSGRKNRPHLKQLSSGTEGSRDNSENKKIDKKLLKSEKKSKKSVKRNLKNEKNSQRSEKSALSNSTNNQTYVYPVQRRLLQRKHPKFLSMKHGLVHHRHKKRKKSKKHKRSDKKSIDREWFLKELEKLIVEFQKCTIAVVKKSLSSNVPNQSVGQNSTSTQNDIVLPSELK